MNRNLLLLFNLLLLLSFGNTETKAQAELVNFEEAWQKFLKEPLTSNIGQLVKPQKSNTNDYLKYSLMFATNYFCADSVSDAQQVMAEIKEIGAEKYSAIPGFKERYVELGAKIKSYHDIQDLWVAFLANRNITHEDLNKYPVAKTVCEKGTLAKYFYISAYAFYCKGDLNGTKTDFERKVMSLVEKANFDPSKVNGMPQEITFMKEIIRVNNLLDKAWKEYMTTDKSPGFKEDLELVKCNVIPNMKIYMLRATTDVCRNGAAMLKKIKELEKINSLPVPADLKKKIEWLEGEVAKYNGILADLNKAWDEFVSTGDVKSGAKYKGIFCEKDAQIKSYTIQGTLEHCTIGEKMLKEIADIRKEFNPTLDKTTLTKIAELEAKLKQEKENVAILNKAWAEFMEKDTNLVNTKFPFEFCDDEMLAKAYILDGRYAICSRGVQRVEDLAALKKKADFESFSADTKSKLKDFEERVEILVNDVEHLKYLWKTFVDNNDTINFPYVVAPFFCDKIHQVKSWCLMGHFNSCDQGQEYLTKIDEFTKKHNLKFDEELACRITRLRIKVWDCVYWELVRKAWELTHAEREDFGPKSAEVMHKDLNGPKQVCETKVEYEPLGKIGIKYIIKIYLCQNIDLAKMGDPDYYKKIANWVNTHVLVKYCSEDFRCKTDFTIYIEGHTDGNPMALHRYKEPFNIPKGTPFTHFIGTQDTLEKTLEKDLMYELKTNMELGLGRAWTVKKQLDFIGVPISIGAYEHPKNEKGGEYRRMEVELNMPNLLLDFFEARLAELLEESGIGPKPKQCKG